MPAAWAFGARGRGRLETIRPVSSRTSRPTSSNLNGARRNLPRRLLKLVRKLKHQGLLYQGRSRSYVADQVAW